MAYASVRRYEVQPGSIPEAVDRVRTGFVPLLRQMQGFQRYYVIQGGEDTLVTVSIFDSEQSAQESAQQAGRWVLENVSQFVIGSPQVTTGEVLVSEG